MKAFRILTAVLLAGFLLTGCGDKTSAPDYVGTWYDYSPEEVIDGEVIPESYAQMEIKDDLSFIISQKLPSESSYSPLGKGTVSSSGNSLTVSMSAIHADMLSDIDVLPPALSGLRDLEWLSKDSVIQELQSAGIEITDEIIPGSGMVWETMIDEMFADFDQSFSGTYSVAGGIFTTTVDGETSKLYSTETAAKAAYDAETTG